MELIKEIGSLKVNDIHIHIYNVDDRHYRLIIFSPEMGEIRTKRLSSFEAQTFIWDLMTYKVDLNTVLYSLDEVKESSNGEV